MSELLHTFGERGRTEGEGQRRAPCPIGRHRGCECRFVIYSVVHGMTVGFT